MAKAGDPISATAPAFYFERDARSLTAMLMISIWLCGLAVLVLVFQAALWLVAALALPVLPALWELWRNPRSWLRIDTEQFCWSSPRMTGEIALTEISHIDMTTRWDFSIRVTLHTHLGTTHKLPPDVTPPDTFIEAALSARGIPVKRHHFTVF